MQGISVSASVFTLVAIAVDRWAKKKVNIFVYIFMESTCFLFVLCALPLNSWGL